MIHHAIQQGSHPRRPPVALALAVTALALAVLLVSGCSEPLAPMLPEWDVDANLPLINQTYTMSDLLNDNEMLRITQNGDNVMVVTQRHPLRAFSLADHLRIDDRQFRRSERLDVLRFDIPDYMDQALDIFTLFPNLPRGMQSVPSMRNELGLGVDIDARSYFEEMTFSKGNLSLIFTNKAPVPLRLEQIRLLNAQGGSIASSSYSGLVQPGATVNLPAISLAGLTLTSRMRLGFDVSTPGSGGAQVDVSSSQYLGIKGSITDSDILSVKGYVPSQEVLLSEQIDIAGTTGMRVKSGTVRGGAVSFTISNHFNLAADIAVTLQGASKDGRPLGATSSVPAKGNATLTIDLTGALLTPQNETMLAYDARVLTEDASNKAVLVKRNDSVSVTAALKSVTFAEMTGRLSPKTLHIRKMERSDFGIDKSIAGAITLSEARMWATLQNQAQLPVGIDKANVLGKRIGGKSSLLEVNAVGIAPHSETLVRFDDGQVVTFLNSFSPELPDSLGLEGTFTLNPDGQYGSASAADSVTGDLFVEFPLRFTQVSGSVTDTVEMFIDEDSRKKLTEVNEGILTFDIENHLPTNVTIEPEFLDSRYKVLLTPTGTDGNPLMAKSAVVGADGFASQAVSEKMQLRFTGTDFATIAKAAFIRFKISFNADQSSASAFRSSDYVRVRGYARLNVSTAITEK
jgi:hypothetical protein